MKKVITHEEISSFCLELSMLLHAGVTVGDGLALLAEESDAEYQALIAAIAEKVDGGLPLSAAMRESERFPAYVCGLLEVGEQAGRTEETLASLSRYYEDRQRMERRVKTAILYPAVMLALMLLVIGVLLVKVLPAFNDVYAALGGQLTGVAGGLLALGRWLDRAMPVLWVLLALAAVLFALFAWVEPFRQKLLLWWRGRRGDKGISGKMNTARFAQAMAMGMASGLPAEEALTLSSGLLADTPAAQKRCENCRLRLEKGERLGQALKDSALLPAAACRLLELGERSGSADIAMEKISRNLMEESDAALESLVGRVEPSLVLVCSVLVGLILLSVMLPLMHIMSAIG